MREYARRKLMMSVWIGIAAVPVIAVMRIMQGGFVPGAIVLGLGLGFTVGFSEYFLFQNRLQHLAFGIHVLVKSVLLMVVMGIAFSVLNLLDVLLSGLSWQQYIDATFNLRILSGLLTMLVLFTVILFFIRLDRLLGPGILINYLTGRYHHPRKEDRIFMFIDLKGSTSLADQMSSEKYFLFLQEYFSELSNPILETNAQVYQYVGDEVVLTWSWKKGLRNNNCIKIFFLFQRTLQTKEGHFLKQYGVIPKFKAGVHGGAVITAELGDIKKEIVYNGDVLNTTSRIQSKCNELGQELLVSSEIVKSLTLPSGYRYVTFPMIELRGKSDAIDLYGISLDDKSKIF